MREPAPTEILERAAAAELERDLLDTAQAGPAAIRGSALRVGGYVVGIGASVLSISLLIRHLGVADFGRYVTVVSLITIVQGVTDAGLATVGVREYAVRTGEARNRLMRNLTGVRLVLTAAGTLVATGFALVAGYGSTLVLGTLVGGAGLVLSVAQGTLAIPLVSQLRLGWVTALDLLRQALTVAAFVALIVAGATLFPFLAVTVPVGIVLLAGTAALVYRSMPLRPSFEVDEWWLLLRQVLPYAAAAAIGVIYFRVTVIVMSLIAGELETGYYATAYRVLEVLIAIPQLLIGATLPILARAARDDEERLRYVLQRLFDAMLIVGAWVALAVVIGAPFAVEVLAGGEADPAVPALRIQALALAANFLATGWMYGLLSLRHHASLLVLSAVALVISVTLTLVLVPRHGADGAAIAVTVGELAVAVMALGLLRRARRDLWPSFATVPRVLPAVALAAAAGFVPGIGPVAGVAAATVVYVGVLAALRAIPAELLQAVRRRDRA